MHHISDVPHRELLGVNRLYNLVLCLGNACPWTKQMKASDMLKFLESEVHELREELSRTTVSKEAIISELGDILFDALMLEMLLRKELNFSEYEPWEKAARKVERRTPYMKEWGDGDISANTLEEAEAIWQSVKKEEKQEKIDGNIRARIDLSVEGANAHISQGIIKSNYRLLGLYHYIPRNLSSICVSSLSVKSHSLSLFIGVIAGSVLGFYLSGEHG